MPTVSGFEGKGKFWEHLLMRHAPKRCLLVPHGNLFFVPLQAVDNKQQVLLGAFCSLSAGTSIGLEA